MKKLRNASSLILATKNKTDVNILALKRSKATSHFPNAFVFPGGNCDEADENPDWLKVFPSSELEVNLNITDVNGKLYNYVANDKFISKAISLRITAVRETFEECGILLCKRRTGQWGVKVSHYELDEKNKWREKIQNDPKEFFKLCQKFDCFPNLKGLHLLSNWITPLNFVKRYDCKFFIAVLDDEVKAEADDVEIQAIKWQTVCDFLQNNDVFLPPPQLYEMSKLKSFSGIESVCQFIEQLDLCVCQPYMPIHVNASNGIIIILPGDEKYELLSDARSENVIEANCDIANFRCKTMHRIEYQSADGTKVVKRSVIIKNCNTYYNSSISKLELSKL